MLILVVFIKNTQVYLNYKFIKIWNLSFLLLLQTPITLSLPSSSQKLESWTIHHYLLTSWILTTNLFDSLHDSTSILQVIKNPKTLITHLHVDQRLPGATTLMQQRTMDEEERRDSGDWGDQDEENGVTWRRNQTERKEEEEKGKDRGEINFYVTRPIGDWTSLSLNVSLRKRILQRLLSVALGYIVKRRKVRRYAVVYRRSVRRPNDNELYLLPLII